MSTPSIYVGSCAWRALEAFHVQCVQRLLQTPGIIYDMKVGDALVDRARSILATRFLMESEADVLVTIDSDILFKPADVHLIAEQAREYDIVAGLYWTRSNSRCIPTSHFLPDHPITLGTTEPQPIKWAASGFTAYRRGVFEELAKDLPLCHPDADWKFYPFYTPFPYDDDEAGLIYLSEDWALAERARAKGFGNYLSPSVQLQHLGVYPFSHETALQSDLPEGRITVTRRRGEGAVYHVALEPDLFQNPELSLVNRFPKGTLIPQNRSERRRMEREKAHA